MSTHRQVSHPSRQRPTLGDAGRKKKDHTPKTDRGWGGAGAVGWGVLGAFGSLEKDTGAQVVRKTDTNVKMVKNEKGLWVKVKVDDAAGAGRGRGRGIPALGGSGSGDMAIGGLQDDDAYDEDDDRGRGSHERDRSPPDSRTPRRRSPSRSSSRDRSRKRKASPSSSRSPSRSRRKRHSRSRSRSRGRDRRRSRSPARHRSSRRSRSRSRSPRGRRERSRSRDGGKRERQRSRSRDRHRDHDRRRPSPDRDSRKRSSPERDTRPSPPEPPPQEEEEEGPPPVMVFTAAQLADRLVEVYNLEAKNRLSQIMECFAADVTLANLKTRADVLKGSEALRDSMPSDYAKWNADCSRRLFMQAAEPASPESPTFCLDLYPAGHAPGMNAMGKGNVKLPTVLLYRVRENRIDKVWIAPDKEGLAEADRTTEQQVLGSKVYAMAAEVVKAELAEGAEVEHVFNDYRNIETWG